jgi:hypothetical protein
VEETVFSLLFRRLNEYREGYADALVAGGAADYAEYRSMTGAVQALDAVIQDVKELESRFIND